MKAKISLIAPHRRMANMAEDVIASTDIECQVYVGELQAGREIALELEKQGVDVIISRGGTYLVIKEAVLSIPIVAIQVTGYDLIRTLKKIENANSIALCGYPNIFWGISDISDLFGLKVKNFVINGNESEIREQLLVAEGIDVVVGDTAGVRLAQKLGFQTLLIESGTEAIIAALQEATRAADVRFNEARKAMELSAILNYIDSGIVSINYQGEITVINPSAEEKLGLVRADILGKKAEDVIENTRLHSVLKSGEAEVGELQQVGGRMFLTNRIPLVVQGKIAGVVATFHDVAKLQNMEHQVRRQLYKKGLVANYSFKDIIRAAKTMCELVAEAKKYAATDSTVLITAETGTGKELFAQSIHNASSRKNGPFVAINCGALPSGLLESELFGYSEGAFTGARKEGKPGIFELAHGGTLFLDEIGEVPLHVQVQLLRVIQEKMVRRVGDDRLLPVDVRIIAATNKDIAGLVATGQFRPDLYYRLDVLRLEVPALRQRVDDIELLFRYFARNFEWRAQLFTPEALCILQAHSWPGNVRELENIVEKLYLLSEGGTVTAQLLARVLPRPLADPAHTLADQQQQLILATLEECGGDKTKAAAKLGISRTTLWRKLNMFQQ